jgi:hypothetical protein
VAGVGLVVAAVSKRRGLRLGSQKSGERLSAQRRG